jgi:hypothetical protein
MVNVSTLKSNGIPPLSASYILKNLNGSTKI